MELEAEEMEAELKPVDIRHRPIHILRSNNFFWNTMNSFEDGVQRSPAGLQWLFHPEVLLREAERMEQWHRR